MKRHLIVALLVLAATPRLAAAQDAGWGPALRITPFVGVSPNFTQSGEAVFVEDGALTSHEYELDFAHGIGLGIAAEKRVWKQVTIVGSGAWLSRGDAELHDLTDNLVFEVDGVTQWIAKAALALRLREPTPELQLHNLNASIFAGPAFIRDVPKREITTPPAAASSHNYLALNLGADAELPFANRKLAFVLGVEDYLVFWDNNRAEGRIAGTLGPSAPAAEISVETRKSNIFLLRFGLSWRF
jgi:hypothetical protein